MENFYSTTLKRKIQQINARKARKLFEQGRTIYLHPNKLRFDNAWQNPSSYNKNEVSSWLNFTMICDHFRQTCCGCGMGSYIHFFIEV